MAFLRFTRDKRGYEHFYLVQPSIGRGKSTARVLYWFRTPPHVKVGREPFDEAIRRELEARNPDVSFDWRKILETPIPSADAEKWRDRRRAERAARAARRAAVPEPVSAVENAAENDVEQDEAGDETIPFDEHAAADDEALSDAPIHVIEAAAEAATAPPVLPAAASNEDAATSNTQPDAESSAAAPSHNQPAGLRPLGSSDASRRKRRRRRRRRGRSGPPGPGGGSPAGPGGDV